MTCSWTLPYPVGVGVNHQYVGMGKRRRLTERARAWKDGAILLIRASGAHLPAGELSCVLELYPPANGRRHDVDGPIKLALDAIAAAFDIDDERFSYVAARRYRDGYGHPSLIVTVT